MLYLRKQCDNTFAFRVNVAKIKEDGNFFPNNNVSNLKSATYWVSWDFACKTTKIHFIVHIPCITETS